MKYLCHCGNEVNNLVVAWSKGQFRPIAWKVLLLCKKDADEWINHPANSDWYSITNIPIKINISTKGGCVNQIIAQYLQKEGSLFYLPKTDVRNALTKVTKENK